MTTAALSRERRENEVTSAFHNLLLALLPRIRTYAFLLTKDRAEADDLTQEAVSKILGAERQFQSGTNFSGWCFTILKNEFIGIVRRKKRFKPLLKTERPSPDASPEAVSFTNQVLTVLDECPSWQRDVLTLAVLGCSYTEMSEKLRCDLGTVRSRLWRARAAMRRRCEGNEGLSYGKRRSRRESVENIGRGESATQY
jgi:RNA polymerase sigma-70 factor (ECF subfamily)